MGQFATNPTDFWIDPPLSLEEALKTHPDPVDLMRKLIRASVQVDVRVDKDGQGQHKFGVRSNLGTSSLDLILTRDRQLLGVDSDNLGKVYAVVREIEIGLAAAMYLPHDQRQQRIDAACARIGVSTDNFSSILRNWSKY